MAITPDMPFEEFVDKVCAKFGKAYGALGFKFRGAFIVSFKPPLPHSDGHFSR